MSRNRLLVCTVFSAIILGGVTRTVNADETVKELVASSNALLVTLSDEQRAKAVLPFNSDERMNWHYVPKDRLGLPIAEMNPEQRELALGVLKSVLSQQGFEKVETIRSLEEVLQVIEGGKGPVRDIERYYFTVFGEPSPDGNWGLRYEGHHLSLHWTIVGGSVVSSLPQFLGSNPGEVKEGPRKGTRPLASEEDIARQLVKSLDEKQGAAAILQQTVPPDIITGAKREASIVGNEGIGYGALTQEQQGVLISLVQLLADVQRPELAAQRIANVKSAGLENLKFAWIGGLERGEKHYYRVQGPTFVIEYDNTQNDANHVHVVWRDFAGDFGLDVLKQHYADHTSEKHPDEHAH